MILTKFGIMNVLVYGNLVKKLKQQSLAVSLVTLSIRTKMVMV